MDANTTDKLIDYLKQFVTVQRWQTINAVLEQRTRHLTVVLEDMYQSHNASAVLRSCDCFGVQDVHVIENKNDFDPDKGVTIGADQWLSVRHYNSAGTDNTLACYEELKKRGYRIIATTPHNEGVTIDRLPVDQKLALAFGTELEGLSRQALDEADGYISIPQYGFSESYNVSVSAALCLYELTGRIREEGNDIPWRLEEGEKRELLLQWLENSVRAAELLKQKFLEGERR